MLREGVRIREELETFFLRKCSTQSAFRYTILEKYEHKMFISFQLKYFRYNVSLAYLVQDATANITAVSGNFSWGT